MKKLSVLVVLLFSFLAQSRELSCYVKSSDNLDYKTSYIKENSAKPGLPIEYATFWIEGLEESIYYSLDFEVKAEKQNGVISRQFFYKRNAKNIEKKFTKYVERNSLEVILDEYQDSKVVGEIKLKLDYRFWTFSLTYSKKQSGSNNGFELNLSGRCDKVTGFGNYIDNTGGSTN